MTKLQKILKFTPRHLAEEYFCSSTRSQYLGSNNILCKILGDKKFYVMSDDIGFSSHMILDGYWEYWLTKYFADTIKPGDTVIDIGANLGYYSILAADLVTATGKVVAVEPNPMVCRLLRNSVSVNGYAGRTEVHNFALSFADAPPQMPFFVPEGEPKNGRFVGENESVEHLNNFGQLFDVEVGSLTPDRFERVDFIKIDVEGAEIAVLEHLRPIIQQFHPKIVCEVNFARGYSYDQVMNVLGATEPMRILDFDAKIKPLTRAMAENERYGEDWLLCYG